MTTTVMPVLVIGSGFGGATAAARLVDAGVEVTLLERGPWRASNAVRDAALDNTAPFPHGRRFLTHLLRNVSMPFALARRWRFHRDGLFDLHLDSGLSVVCSSGVGGGSHVYSAMNVQPPADYWNNHHAAVNADAMAPHYNWILTRMGSRRISEANVSVPNAIVDDAQRPDWMQVDADQQPAMGFRFDQQRFSNNSFFGSRDNSKVGLDELLLLPRLGKGLTVKARHEVLDIHRGSHHYRVTVKDHQHNRIDVLLAEKVILAAGTLNTLKLLFTSRERGGLQGMPALGQGIGGNGDVPAYWPCNEKGRDFSHGTPCHGRFALPDDDTNLTRYGLNGVDQMPLPSLLRRRLKRDLVLVGMGADNATGIARWHRGTLRIEYRQGDNPVLEKIYRAFDRISELSGIRVWFLRRYPLTVHPFGGARLGDDPQHSVVNGHGEVHDNPGLFIADASALPAAPGVPPSMTIAAWAGHLAMSLVSVKGEKKHVAFR